MHDRLERVLGLPLPQVDLARAIGPDDQDPGALQPPGDAGQQGQRGGVRPLEVVQHHQQRELLAHAAQDLGILLQDLVLVDRGVDHRHGGHLLDPAARGALALAGHQQPDVGQECAAGDEQADERGTQRGDRVPAEPPDRVGVACLDLVIGLWRAAGAVARQRLQDRPERQKGVAAARLGIAPTDRDHEIVLPTACPGRELGHQARLAGSALTTDETHRTVATEHAVEGRVEAAQLPVPRHEIEAHGAHRLIVGIRCTPRKTQADAGPWSRT